MKPVMIVQFSASEGPGHLGDYLVNEHIPFQVLRIDRGEALPADIHAYSGLAMMGGPMSVNDDLPWIPPLLALVREAVAQRIPVIGHCLGGQMLAKAMGGEVTDSRFTEIGWVRAWPEAVPHAVEWLGSHAALDLFQWHYQTFSLPPGAVHILRSEHCANQAYVLDDLHIGFQCHIEMKAEMVREWCGISPEELKGGAEADPAQPMIQSAAEIMHDLDARIATLNQWAGHVYARWAKSLKRD
ncbi:type 1 glutamine amidotransferase [Methylobacillus flagellatus]|uniref:type 1 glutamine amidotransferase n=1 Tax=Methylobacillus flagellatus TaxID=405 RepID=UPI002853DAE3|nr:type 1 glutamine amidotransferase [Methylobacillus flagellatus]MDR5170483.1 type 1 glutamine amidotransferase [Methylobacillus flagellatus]